jgi:hypothetical protein
VKSIMRGVFPYVAGVALALGLVSAARAQNTLPAPNMSVSIWGHKGSFYPDEPPSAVNSNTVNPPKPGTYFWRICAINPSKFSE